MCILKADGGSGVGEEGEVLAGELAVVQGERRGEDGAGAEVVEVKQRGRLLLLPIIMISGLGADRFGVLAERLRRRGLAGLVRPLDPRQELADLRGVRSQAPRQGCLYAAREVSPLLRDRAQTLCFSVLRKSPFIPAKAGSSNTASTAFT